MTVLQLKVLMEAKAKLYFQKGAAVRGVHLVWAPTKINWSIVKATIQTKYLERVFGLNQ